MAILKFKNETPISIYDVNIDRIVVSNKVPFCKKGFKYTIGYKDVKKFNPLFTILPKMSTYRRHFDDNKYVFFIKKQRNARKV